ncbi:MAG TPA: hypothetical protein VG937_26935 [Polyangiaceae bacterium]|nr:hypothetical protein [Polyangiaceae bacterium]
MRVAFAVAFGSCCLAASSCAANSDTEGHGASGGVVGSGGRSGAGNSGGPTLSGGSEARGGATTDSGGSALGGTSAGGSPTGGASGGSDPAVSGGTMAGSGGSSVSSGGSAGSGGVSGGGGGRAGSGGADGGGPSPTGGVAGAGAAGGVSTGGGGTLGGRPSTSGGVAGAGGSGDGDDRAAAQVLDGLAILKPCVSTFKPSGNANNNGDCCCEELAANENQHFSKQFGGDANVTYNVKVRIAGVAERYWYAGGTLDTVSKLFYTGGLPTIHSTQAPNSNLRAGVGACKIHPPETDGQFALSFTVPAEIKPTDGCYNGFNVFALTVSAPKQSYYLNYTTEFDGVDRQPHSVYKTDYTVTIPITGQAKIDFYTIDGDHHQVTNNGTMSVPNVKTMQPYNGNFLEFTVLDVTRAN